MNEDEIVYEEDAENAKKGPKKGDSEAVDDESGAPEALVKKLKEKIKILEKEKQEYMDGWQRERADFVNYKKRSDQEKIDVIKYSNENLVSELIPVLESFEMAFANKEAWEKIDKNWRVGVEYIHTQLLKVLGDYGFKEMNPVGEKFDPKLHVAEEVVTTDDEKKDGIISVVKKKGYMLNDRVVIAPKVVVFELK
jgi:molecular chaperone GrpE